MKLVVCPSCGRHAFDHEAACPHCGQRGRPTLLALTVALGLATACGNNADHAVGVYGAAPVQTSARVTASTETPPTAPPSAAPTASEAPSAAPSSSAATSSSATPTSTSVTPAPTPAEPRNPPPVKVYGPPPRDPLQRK